MRYFLLFFIFLPHALIFGQRESIGYELNGRLSNREVQDSTGKSNNPFAPFVGEWTLKNDTWTQNWGGTNDTIQIPGHHTSCHLINTDNSLLSIIDGPEPNGHIFWSYDPASKKVSHLSSFGTNRAGVGQGEFYGNGNLRLKISFADEAPGTYRVYTYEWVNDSEYAMLSVQYDENDRPTGLFYQGNFVRQITETNVRREVAAILRVLDNNDITKEEQINVYADDVIHMAPGHQRINDKKELLTYLKQQQTYGRSEMRHEITELSTQGRVVIMTGKVSGIFYPASGGDAVPFQTKNLFVFKRDEDGRLKISKVIYNLSPV